MNFVELIEQYGPLVAILAGVASVLGVAFSIYKSAHNRQVQALENQIRELQAENDKLGREGNKSLKPMVKELQKQLEEKRREIEVWQQKHAASKRAGEMGTSALHGECDKLRETSLALTTELEKAKEELGDHEREQKRRANLMKKAMTLQGKVWERKVMQGAPRFCPLTERHTPVISILNLKGGVGKTTITANLGAAFSAKGYSVLLVDLDLQGSLSSLFMNESTLVQRSKEGRLLQHFLLNTSQKRKANILECSVPIFDGKSAIVPNADGMAYAELNLTMQWLLRQGKRDTRFLLRKALQQKRITNRYDVVILDCPPLFSTCCINALAASDYIIIPVLPSKKAAERVPLLVERLHSLHQVINPQLQIMGALLNRTWAAQLTSKEKDLWDDMLEQAQTRWGLPIYAFDATIRQTTEVRDSEAEFSPPAPGSELHGVFSRILVELEERLPRDCRRTADSSLGLG